MITFGRMTDYGLVLLAHIARRQGELHSARDLALLTRLPRSTVSKLLKTLAGAKLLKSFRGARGGYGLARTPEEITVFEIVAALEGPITLTICESELDITRCRMEGACPISPNWQPVNRALRQALSSLTLADMARPQTAKRAAEKALPVRAA